MVSEDGNITISRVGNLPWILAGSSEGGQPVDMTALNLRFIVERVFEIIPGFDATRPLARVLDFTAWHASKVGSKVRRWVLVVDPQDGEPYPLYSGTIQTTDFAITDEEA